MSEAVDILIAEDDETDVLLLRRAFKEAGLVRPMHVAADGQAAIDYLTAREQSPEDRLPALIILDLKMPRCNGIEVLQWIRAQPGLRCVPTVIFSSSSRREDVERAYLLGANAFFVKPPSTVQRTEFARFLGEWLKFNQTPLASTEGFRAARALHAGGTLTGDLELLPRI
jgi:CheY-like chemotaxis protein